MRAHRRASRRKEPQTTMANPIRIAVIDDHPLYRKGTVQTLTEAEGLEVVAEGATAADALKAAHECLPAVILLDLRIPGGGVEAVCQYCRLLSLRMDLIQSSGS
jgi:DNA-binding NarL/FixJ family response regulator